MLKFVLSEWGISLYQDNLLEKYLNMYKKTSKICIKDATHLDDEVYYDIHA